MKAELQKEGARSVQNICRVDDRPPVLEQEHPDNQPQPEDESDEEEGNDIEIANPERQVGEQNVPMVPVNPNRVAPNPWVAPNQWAINRLVGIQRPRPYQYVMGPNGFYYRQNLPRQQYQRHQIIEQRDRVRRLLRSDALQNMNRDIQQRIDNRVEQQNQQINDLYPNIFGFQEPRLIIQNDEDEDEGLPQFGLAYSQESFKSFNDDVLDFDLASWQAARDEDIMVNRQFYAQDIKFDKIEPKVIPVRDKICAQDAENESRPHDEASNSNQLIFQDALFMKDINPRTMFFKQREDENSNKYFQFEDSIDEIQINNKSNEIIKKLNRPIIPPFMANDHALEVESEFEFHSFKDDASQYQDI